MRRAIVSVLAVALLSCAPTTRASKELVALRFVEAAQAFANAELAHRCPTDDVLVNEDLIAQCVVMADRNVAAQQSMVTGLAIYDAQVAGGSKESIAEALASLKASACYIVGIFPNATKPTNADLMECYRGTR